MSIFDQRGQNVTYQYNVNGCINVAAAGTGPELAGELHKLSDEIDRARSAGVVTPDVALDTKYQIEKAAQQAEAPTPDKDSIVTHLTTAKELVAQVGAAAGLVGGLVQTIDKVQAMF